MTKTELIKDSQVYFDYLSSDKINVCNILLAGEEMIDVHYESNEDFIAPNSKTNVVIAALQPFMHGSSCTIYWTPYKNACYTTIRIR